MLNLTEHQMRFFGSAFFNTKFYIGTNNYLKVRYISAMIRKLWVFMAAMGGVIALSNVLVQYQLGDWLTYGALTYPLAFLVTDVVTRLHGSVAARRVIGVGFVVGIICSFLAELVDLTTLRIAIGSATAFIVAQSLDVQVFEHLRNLAWWKTPIISSTIGSLIDTFIFFSIAFSGVTYAVFADGNDWALEQIPLLGIGPVFPLWVSLAVADLFVKIVLLPILLIPYRALTNKFQIT